MVDTLSVLRGLPSVSEEYRNSDWLQRDDYYPVYTGISSIVKPDVILEIGTLHGCSIISMLNGNTSTDRVYWIDNEKNEKGSNEKCKENLDHYLAECTPPRELLCGFSENPFCSLEFKKSKVKKDDLLLMHVDGEHTVDGKLRDLLIADSVKPDVLLVDDYTYCKEVAYAVDTWARWTDKKIMVLATYRGLVVYVYNESRREEWERKIGGLL